VPACGTPATNENDMHPAVNETFAHGRPCAEPRDRAILIAVNGQPHYLCVAPGATLLQVLRDDLLLDEFASACAGRGCGGCGVCANGRRVRACTTPAAALDGADVLTPEGERREAALAWAC
jgi:aerobic-type carbon monoxide dehydrogenase small subunit (CoxS/CutS family)